MSEPNVFTVDTDKLELNTVTKRVSATEPSLTAVPKVRIDTDGVNVDVKYVEDELNLEVVEKFVPKVRMVYSLYAIEDDFVLTTKHLQYHIHQNNVSKGFWEEGIDNRNKAEMIALMHSELSEALEALRKPELKDEHLPEEDPVGLELADVVIRIMDYCEAYGINLGDLIVKKHKYNTTRSYKHGGKKF